MEGCHSIDASFTSLGSLSSGASAGELEGDLGREALKEICCGSLSRVLDLSDNKLEVLLGEESDADTGSNVARNIANKLKSLSHKLKFDDTEMEAVDSSYSTLTFGASISTDSQTVLLQFMAYLETFATEEGLFRKPGSRSRIEQLVQQLSTLPLEQVITNPGYSPHDFASTFKLFFSELPEPILLSRHMVAYEQAADMVSNEARCTLCLQLLMLLLPPSHHVVFSRLLQLLYSVSQCPQSKMNAHNLAVVFAPSLFFDAKSDSFIPSAIGKMVQLLEHMIIHCMEIFEIPTEVRVVADNYVRRRGSAQTEDELIPVDIYSTSCQRSSVGTFHKNGQDNAVAELASLYEHVQKMPDGPQKLHFLKKFESHSKIPGTPPAYIKRKQKENVPTPRVKLGKGIGSQQIATPLRPKFKKSMNLAESQSVHHYATPLKASLTQYERLETDV